MIDFDSNLSSKDAPYGMQQNLGTYLKLNFMTFKMEIFKYLLYMPAVNKWRLNLILISCKRDRLVFGYEYQEWIGM